MQRHKEMKQPCEGRTKTDREEERERKGATEEVRKRKEERKEREKGPREQL